jgi:L,D-peptidoglycan transpeptidase YkuD (ErfK/YbiS/YcfS/YnhG family)
MLQVASAPVNRARGVLRMLGATTPVALGRTGVRANKREGDGATPRGRFRLVRLWWRADRLARPASALPTRPIASDDAWCEDPADRRYNQPVKLTSARAGDRLRRDDSLYDLLIELDHNTRPRISGRGSAIFIHVARPGLRPTSGCIALEAGALRRLLVRLKRNSTIEIG